MERNTLLAVVLSTAVIFGFYFIQAKFFPPPQRQAAQATSEAAAPVELLPPPQALLGSPFGDTEAEGLIEETITVETDFIKVILTNAGGDIASYKLKQHLDREDYVEMILPGIEEPHAFSLAFGGAAARSVRDLFYVNRVSPTIVEFYQDFLLPQSNAPDAAIGQYRLTKRYTFNPQEYMFELTVTLDGGPSATAINYSGTAYTLGFGPQIGPNFAKLDSRYDYRHYYTYANGKRKDEKLKENAQATIATRVLWAAVAGKYFTFIAIPDATQYQVTFSTRPEPGLPAASRLYLSRPALSVSRASDTFRFYLGPKDQKSLSIYDMGSNDFNLRNMDFSKAFNTAGILAPLEAGLKWFLVFFYGIIPNYGVAIILLTLLVKIAMFPLTKKSTESTLRMQALSPKIKEIQDKYKDNPTQLNAKMAELYKQEGYNPAAGCLPMGLQMPLFFAMYGLFNNHFDLRGAMFIPGWIPDLSIPESIFNFAPFQLPLLGWSDIRLLPFIYVGSQLLSTKITETPDQKGNSQMKLMLYIMPITFFFVLYNVPSGLLIYWIMTNFLTLIQQVLTVKFKLFGLGAPASPAQPVIAPKKLKKR